MRSLLLAIATAAITMPLAATATSFERAYGLNELSSRAETVVVGEVQGTWTETTSDGWWTVATLVVDETLQGSHEPVVEVRYPGGSVGDLHLVVSGAPALHPGDDVVVFTRPGGKVLGLAQGVWKIEEDGQATRDLSRLAFKDGAHPVESMPLQALKDMMR